MSESLVKYCASLQNLLMTGGCLSIQLTLIKEELIKLFKAVKLYNNKVRSVLYVWPSMTKRGLVPRSIVWLCVLKIVTVIFFEILKDYILL